MSKPIKYMYQQLSSKKNLILNLLVLLWIETTYADMDVIEPETINSLVLEQEQGNYGEMKRESTPLGAIQTVWDKKDDNLGIYNVLYKKDSIIKLRLREYMKSLIILPEWEVAERLLVGDHSVLNATQLDNQKIVLESQGYVGVDTNLQVIGQSGNVYLFYIRIDGYNSHYPPDLKTYILSRQQGQIKHRKLKKNDTYLEEVIYKPKDLTFAYQMYGSKKIAPKLVFNDGYRTWLFYGRNVHKKELPAIYETVDDTDILVNSTLINQSIVVSSVGNLTLKLGNEVTCIRYKDE